MNNMKNDKRDKKIDKPIRKEKIKCPYLERYGAHFEYCSYCFPLKVKTQNEKTYRKEKIENSIFLL